MKQKDNSCILLVHVLIHCCQFTTISSNNRKIYSHYNIQKKEPMKFEIRINISIYFPSRIQWEISRICA